METTQSPMNGAESLVKTLLTSGVDTCFANPGTSEMHFVAALDRIPGMRCVLGLFEGVVTGAADGYARMADKPAATLLHCGPGPGQWIGESAQRTARADADRQHHWRSGDLPPPDRCAADRRSPKAGRARCPWDAHRHPRRLGGADAAAAVQAAARAPGGIASADPAVRCAGMPAAWWPRRCRRCRCPGRAGRRCRTPRECCAAAADADRAGRRARARNPRWPMPTASPPPRRAPDHAGCQRPRHAWPGPHTGRRPHSVFGRRGPRQARRHPQRDPGGRAGAGDVLRLSGPVAAPVPRGRQYPCARPRRGRPDRGAGAAGRRTGRPQRQRVPAAATRVPRETARAP